MGLLVFGAEAQEPTATINTLQGEVFVAISGDSQKPGLAGTVLRAGDSIQTALGAAAVLMLPGGSRVELEENTQLTIEAFFAEQPAGVNTPRLRLHWGAARAILSPAYQEAGSSFTVQTPNAVVGVSSSEADLEVAYTPHMRMTTALAHEFELTAINSSTGVARRIPQGHSGLIYDGVIQQIAEIVPVSSTAADAAPTATLTTVQGAAMVVLHGDTLVSARQATVLRQGEAIRTHSRATAGLDVSTGSRLELGENTVLTLAALAGEGAAGGPSRFELAHGRLRVVLPPANDAPETESGCIIQTPNVWVELAAADAEAEVRFDPNTRTTSVIAQQQDLLTTNRLTGTMLRIPQGHSGIIQNAAMQEIARVVQFSPDAAPPETPPPAPDAEAEQQPAETDAAQ